MNAQSRHLIIVGRFDHLHYFQCFWFYFILIFAWKCFSWCYIHHLSILYSFFEFIAVSCYFNSIKCDHMKSYAFICISFILFLIKQFICILFQFHFHTNASICIHSKRVLFIKKFLLTLNLGFRIWSFVLIFLGCYKPSPLKLNLVPRFEKNWILREIG